MSGSPITLLEGQIAHYNQFLCANCDEVNQRGQSSYASYTKSKRSIDKYKLKNKIKYNISDFTLDL
jgi:hypothetical protein